MAIDRELLGKSIRKVRELRGLSQAALAGAAGLQGNSVALIERGERNVSMESLNALAQVLRVPAACLAMLGTSEIAGEASSKSLVSSMQKLILATMVAQQTIETKEKAEQTKQREIEKALRSMQQVLHVGRSQKKASGLKPAKRRVKKLEHP
jgi:transcriptional regulator with XRE-family HTH domain